MKRCRVQTPLRVVELGWRNKLRFYTGEVREKYMAVRLEKETLAERRSRYDWPNWLDGNVWQGRQGEDFTCKETSFVSQLYKAAYDRGLRIHVRPLPDGIVEWEAYESDEDEHNNSIAV